ncbi:tripartite tricarboxylate transporter substrate binding protein [Pigmentiphaga sp. GD03639]|uniref:Tripartite tricarboxylate transporter substrate binding protein n=1 Tax=Pigmentiphaga daeguensis TaxID=414049 RepID=A0ABN1CY58_9BURK|nr:MULTISPECIES: tripartite tricarboxylate transporter substrate binding protein [unclassified Pigmentiphaga]MDH2238703.1 tripartite tricarboxylate transporter substrate binding protein [Pigmentiphaga sp. GD03639]OVZ58950.1 ABC transporter ATP-binding protein [Pigmentiphaga sp. NML030171]
MRQTAWTACAVAVWAAIASPAQADDGAFPNRPVRIVVPFSAGGTADVLPRIIGEKLNAAWGQPVIIDNRPGAGGNIGADMVAKAAPDGYTLMATPPAPLTINQYLYKNLPFDPERFAPVTVLARVPNVLAVKTGLPVKSAQDFIGYARKNGGQVTVATQGNGTTSHLTGALVAAQAGLDFVFVPYKGTAPALADLMGGQVDAFFDNISSTFRQHESGKVRILAVTSAQRSPLLPKTPTLAESGLPGFDVSTWFGVVAPAGTPPEVVRKLNAAIVEVLKMPDVRQKFIEQGAEVVGDTPAQMAEFMRAERAKWKQAIDTADVTIN